MVKRLAFEKAVGQQITTTLHVSMHLDAPAHFALGGKLIGDSNSTGSWALPVVDLERWHRDFEINRPEEWRNGKPTPVADRARRHHLHRVSPTNRHRHENFHPRARYGSRSYEIPTLALFCLGPLLVAQKGLLSTLEEERRTIASNEAERTGAGSDGCSEGKDPSTRQGGGREEGPLFPTTSSSSCTTRCRTPEGMSC
jgi:hypothetical protein